MKLASRWMTAMQIQMPLMTALMLALVASTLLLATKHAQSPRPGYVVAGETGSAQSTPYGSGAAVRSLLF